MQNVGRAVFILHFALCMLTVALPIASHAVPRNPKHWTMEVRGGVFQPTGGTMESFFGGCCNVTGGIAGGPIFASRYGVDLNLGFLYGSGAMRGIASGSEAQDQFSLFLVPIALDGTFRVHYRETQPVVPFVKAGVDMIYFREHDAETTIQGLKWGLHGGGGLMVSLNPLLGEMAPGEYGWNDVFFVVDGRYQWVNNFGGGGLDLSGWATTAGVHVQF